jgi:plastocyanin
MRGLVAMTLGIALSAACGSKHAPPEPRELHVDIRGMQFVPPALHVHRGDLVVFTNHDLVPHTATSSGWFDSGSLSPGQSWTYVIRETVEFDYVCSFHPTMKGQLISSNR